MLPITAPVPPPDTSDPVKRGEYLSEISRCGSCHTPRKGMPPQPDMARAFGGGNDFGGVVTSNITPDASGISYYAESLFIQVMRTGQVRARKIKPPMPWPFYRNMTDEDLKAIFSICERSSPSAIWWTTPSRLRCARFAGRSMASATATSPPGNTPDHFATPGRKTFQRECAATTGSSCATLNLVVPTVPKLSSTKAVLNRPFSAWPGWRICRAATTPFCASHRTPA